MATSESDITQLQSDVVKLREQIAAEEAKRLERERDLANDVTVAALQAEKNTLAAQLADLKERSKVSAVKAGAQAVIDPSGTADQVEQARLDALAGNNEKAGS